MLLPDKYLTKVSIIGLSVILVLWASTFSISSTSYSPKPVSKKQVFFMSVIEKLLRRGADSAFVFSIIDDPRSHFDEKYVKINVTGYLKQPDYSKFLEQSSVEATKEFLARNNRIFIECVKKYGVEKEYIAAILKLETNHGDYLGNHHILSVFLSTALADQPEYIEMNKAELRKQHTGSSDDRANLEEKIRIRAGKKSQWAINELLALEKLNRILPLSLLDLRGSWAGAFGMPQFLPSSFLHWATDGNGDGVINLYETEDAIFSVANYLIGNGWGKSAEAQKKALYSYNNSQAYVDAVTALASLLTVNDRLLQPLGKQLRSFDKDS